MAALIPSLSTGPLHPDDERHLERYARGEISSREFVRRVLRRLGAQVPDSLVGERSERVLVPEPLDAPVPVADVVLVAESPAGAAPSASSTMSDETAAFARGELDLASWLTQAERKYADLRSG